MAKNESNLNTNSSKNKSIKKKISKDIVLQIENLSYEESLEELDRIIKRLQEETILVEELQQSYLKANLYLDHCERLLDIVEQQVVEIDIDD